MHLDEIDGPLELQPGQQGLVWAYTVNTSGRYQRGDLKEENLSKMAGVIAIRLKWTAKDEDLRD